MKLSLTFLALAVATVQADLTTKWNLDYLTAAKDGSSYTLTYNNIGTEMSITNMKSSVTQGDCTGTAFAVNDAGTVSGLTTPVDDMSMTFVGSADNTGVATVIVDIETKTASTSSLWIPEGTEGGGELKYCVRYGLYASTNEINFSETVVTLTITMVGGFAVDTFEVAEKDKTASTQTAAYTVTAELCEAKTGAFNQGSLICVKVLPSSGDVEITGITAFSWTNEDGILDSGITASTQLALPTAGGDGLTSYDAGSDTFSTILYAEFYESGIAVAGSGTATLGFTTARRLGASGSEKNGRVLQEADVVQDFDIIADIVKSDDSPTALQTAGGATASFVVTIVGLVGAVLLA